MKKPKYRCAKCKSTHFYYYYPCDHVLELDVKAGSVKPSTEGDTDTVLRCECGITMIDAGRYIEGSVEGVTDINEFEEFIGKLVAMED